MWNIIYKLECYFVFEIIILLLYSSCLYIMYSNYIFECKEKKRMLKCFWSKSNKYLDDIIIFFLWISMVYCIIFFKEIRLNRSLILLYKIIFKFISKIYWKFFVHCIFLNNYILYSLNQLYHWIFKSIVF